MENSCPRDERLCIVTYLRPVEDSPWNLSDDHNTIVLRDLRGTLNWAPILPINASLSYGYTSDWRCCLHHKYFFRAFLFYFFLGHPVRYVVLSGPTFCPTFARHSAALVICSFEIPQIHKQLTSYNWRTGTEKWN